MHADSIERLWIDRLNYREGSKQELALSIAKAAKLPSSWTTVLQRAAVHDQLELILACLADECAKRSVLMARTRSSVYSSMGVMLLAWIGVLVMIWSTVPAIDTAFQVLYQEPTWWLKVYRALFESRWIWFLGTPAIAVFIAWIAYRRKEKVTEWSVLRKVLLEAKNRTWNVPRSEDTDSSSVAVDNFVELMLSDSRLREEQPAFQIYSTERETSNEEWRIQKLGIRLSLLATLLVVTVYLAVGILPLIWLVYSQMGHSS